MNCYIIDDLSSMRTLYDLKCHRCRHLMTNNPDDVWAIIRKHTPAEIRLEEKNKQEEELRKGRLQEQEREKQEQERERQEREKQERELRKQRIKKRLSTGVRRSFSLLRQLLPLPIIVGIPGFIIWLGIGFLGLVPWQELSLSLAYLSVGPGLITWIWKRMVDEINSALREDSGTGFDENLIMELLITQTVGGFVSSSIMAISTGRDFGTKFGLWVGGILFILFLIGPYLYYFICYLQIKISKSLTNSHSQKKTRPK